MTKTTKEYLEEPNQCPVCNSSNIDGNGVEIEMGEAFQEVGCNTCNAVWIDHYELAGYRLIEAGDQK